MQDLINIIQTLNKREISLVRLILSQKLNGEEKLRLNLFETILKGTDLNEASIKSKLYAKKTTSAFSHLKRRLRNDILNVLLLQDSSKKVRAKMFAVSIDLKKNMAFAELLYRRGLGEEGDDVINESLKLSNEFELLGESYILTDLQRIRKGTVFGSKVALMYNQRIESFVDFIKSNAEAVSLYYELNEKYLSKSNLDISADNSAELLLRKLENLYKKWPYARNGYWFRRCAIAYYIKLNNYVEAIMHGNCLLELIENSPALYNPVTLAGTSKELAEIAISGHNYNIAKSLSEKALKLFNPKLNNYLMTLEDLFFANFYLRNFSEANTIIEQMARNHPRFNSSKLTPIRWNYFAACTELALGNFKDSFGILEANAKTLVADKGEFQLGYRIMRIILLYELGKEDIISFELDSFRKSFKFIKNYKLDRVKVIHKILSTLDRDSFDFDLTYSKEVNRISLLKNDTAYQWVPIGFELIRFEDWFESKLKVIVQSNQ